ncbi:MAG: hypothetical protein ACK4RV_15925 [Caulobacter sp.]
MQALLGERLKVFDRALDYIRLAPAALIGGAALAAALFAGIRFGFY